MKTQNKDIRHNVVLVFFILVAILITMRLFYLQIIKHKFWLELSEDQRTRIVTVAPNRGDIMDRNGNILATSIDKYSIYVRPKGIDDKSNIMSALIRGFPGEAGLIRDKFSTKTNFWLKRKIDKEEADKARDLKCTGIDITKETKRLYPKGDLAGQLIGFVGADNNGLAGIELSMEKYLLGTSGQYLFEKDIRGRQIATASSKQIIAPDEGMNVYLTIDEAIQYVAQRELSVAVEKWRPTAASITVMDVKTGDILAIAAYPDYDPNNYGQYPSSRWKLSPINDQYEPGSTFKIFTVAAGVDYGVVQPDSVIPCPDQLAVGRAIIKNSHAVKMYGKSFKTLRDVLAESINTGTSFVGLKLGPEKFYSFIKKFGFGEYTDIDFPGEAKGTIPKPEKWKPVDSCTASFGQGLSITPIQLVRAVATIANNGEMMRPKLIKKIESPDKDVVRSDSPYSLGKKIPESTVKQVKELMEGSVMMEHSSGRYSRMLQFRTAGKTGTAQKVVNGRYGQYIASFVGFCPFDDPRLAILVIIDEPRGAIWGEVTAAPVFKSVGEFALRQMNVKPDKKESDKPKPL